MFTLYHILPLLVPLYFRIAYGNEFNLNIPGPKQYGSKIAIVGAGPSGVHMAHLLKEKGFTNVTLLEKSSRVGGKAFTLQYRGTYHDMGAIYLTTSYRNSIMPLVQKYTPDDDIEIPDSALWTSRRPLRHPQYIVDQVVKRNNVPNVMYVQQMLVTAYKKYIRLHKLICGDYEFALMPKPSKLGMYMIRGTMEEFLKRNNMLVLAPIFEAVQTIIGFGQLNDTATLYYLVWVDRTFMAAIFETSNGAGKISFSLKKGTQRLWDVIVQQDRLDVRYNITIRKVRRVLGPQPEVWINKKVNGFDWHWEKFDFLIWSPEMKVSLPLFDKIYPSETIFNRTTAVYLTTSLVNTEDVQRSFSPKEYFMDNMKSRDENSVWGQVDQYGLRNAQQGLAYMNGTFPTGNDGEKMRTFATFQVGSKETTIEVYQKKLEDHFTSLGGRIISVRNTTIWRYFPSYSPSDIDDGALWKILDLQGKYGMWYIGSSVSFESLRDVVEYNRLISKHMVLPASASYATSTKTPFEQLFQMWFSLLQSKNGAIFVIVAFYTLTIHTYITIFVN